MYYRAMNILAIESSCDETSIAVVRNGTDVLSNETATSMASFSKKGGVIPEEAARKQVEFIIPTLNRALSEADISVQNIDSIAVTHGPGLLVSLLVGTTTARTLASMWNKDLIPVHHTLGHLSSTWLEIESQPQFPILTLSASGGHTDIWYRTSHTKGQLLGRTLDDAAGEAFDKGASMLGLSFPGGPSISKEADSGNISSFPFPLPLQGDGSCNFSFSGLKTALKYTLRDHEKDARDLIPNLCASYQHAICIHLIDRVKNALEKHPDSKEIHLVGGVSANRHLRAELQKISDGRTFRVPTSMKYCTDNAAMIGAAAFYMLEENAIRKNDIFSTSASLSLESVVSA